MKKENIKVETRGRKKKPDGDKYEFIINSRLSRKQYKIWKIYVAKQGKRESEVLRDVVLKELKSMSFDDLISTIEFSLKGKK